MSYESSSLWKKSKRFPQSILGTAEPFKPSFGQTLSLVVEVPPDRDVFGPSRVLPPMGIWPASLNDIPDRRSFSLLSPSTDPYVHGFVP